MKSVEIPSNLAKSWLAELASHLVVFYTVESWGPELDLYFKNVFF